MIGLEIEKMHSVVTALGIEDYRLANSFIKIILFIFCA